MNKLMIAAPLTAALALTGCNKNKVKTASVDAAAEPTDTTVVLEQQTVALEPMPAFVIEVVDNFKRVRFDVDSAKLTASAKEELDRAAEIMREHPFVRVSAIGHADERGSDDYNMELGFDRAEAVERYLEARGVDEDRVYVASAGENHPLVEADTTAAWDFNRRVEFRVAWDPFDEVDGTTDNVLSGSPEDVSALEE